MAQKQSQQQKYFSDGGATRSSLGSHTHLVDSNNTLFQQRGSQRTSSSNNGSTFGVNRGGFVFGALHPVIDGDGGGAGVIANGGSSAATGGVSAIQILPLNTRAYRGGTTGNTQQSSFHNPQMKSHLMNLSPIFPNDNRMEGTNNNGAVSLQPLNPVQILREGDDTRLLMEPPQQKTPLKRRGGGDSYQTTTTTRNRPQFGNMESPSLQLDPPCLYATPSSPTSIATPAPEDARCAPPREGEGGPRRVEATVITPGGSFRSNSGGTRHQYRQGPSKDSEGDSSNQDTLTARRLTSRNHSEAPPSLLSSRRSQPNGEIGLPLYHKSDKFTQQRQQGNLYGTNNVSQNARRSPFFMGRDGGPAVSPLADVVIDNSSTLYESTTNPPTVVPSFNNRSLSPYFSYCQQLIRSRQPPPTSSQQQVPYNFANVNDNNLAPPPSPSAMLVTSKRVQLLNNAVVGYSESLPGSPPCLFPPSQHVVGSTCTNPVVMSAGGGGGGGATATATVIMPPSHIAASPSHIAASPSHIAASPSHIAASPSHIAASPSHIAASPSPYLTSTSSSPPFINRSENPNKLSVGGTWSATAAHNKETRMLPGFLLASAVPSGGQGIPPSGGLGATCFNASAPSLAAASWQSSGNTTFVSLSPHSHETQAAAPNDDLRRTVKRPHRQIKQLGQLEDKRSDGVRDNSAYPKSPLTASSSSAEDKSSLFIGGVGTPGTVSAGERKQTKETPHHASSHMRDLRANKKCPKRRPDRENSLSPSKREESVKRKSKNGAASAAAPADGSTSAKSPPHKQDFRKLEEFQDEVKAKKWELQSPIESRNRNDKKREVRNEIAGTSVIVVVNNEEQAQFLRSSPAERVKERCALTELSSNFPDGGESREVETREGESREVETREGESRGVESREGESRGVESREMESRGVESRGVESRGVENANDHMPSSTQNDDYSTTPNDGVKSATTDSEVSPISSSAEGANSNAFASLRSSNMAQFNPSTANSSPSQSNCSPSSLQISLSGSLGALCVSGEPRLVRPPTAALTSDADNACSRSPSSHADLSPTTVADITSTELDFYSSEFQDVQDCDHLTNQQTHLQRVSSSTHQGFQHAEKKDQPFQRGDNAHNNNDDAHNNNDDAHNNNDDAHNNNDDAHNNNYDAHNNNDDAHNHCESRLVSNCLKIRDERPIYRDLNFQRRTHSASEAIGQHILMGDSLRTDRPSVSRPIQSAATQRMHRSDERRAIRSSTEFSTPSAVVSGCTKQALGSASQLVVCDMSEMVCCRETATPLMVSASCIQPQSIETLTKVADHEEAKLAALLGDEYFDGPTSTDGAIVMPETREVERGTAPPDFCCTLKSLSSFSDQKDDIRAGFSNIHIGSKTDIRAAAAATGEPAGSSPLSPPEQAAAAAAAMGKLRSDFKEVPTIRSSPDTAVGAINEGVVGATRSTMVNNHPTEHISDTTTRSTTWFASVTDMNDMKMHKIPMETHRSAMDVFFVIEPPPSSIELEQLRLICPHCRIYIKNKKQKKYGESTDSSEYMIAGCSPSQLIAAGLHPQKINSGTFCAVLKGYLDGEVVAVKCPQDYLLASDYDMMRYRALQEWYILARTAAHPNILGLKAGVFFHGQIWLVTDYCDGGDLYALLYQQPAMLLRSGSRLNLMCQLVSAVRFLHSLHPKIAHKDLKCNNLLVTKRLQMAVCDFGDAEEMKGPYLERCTAATWQYTPPELLASEDPARPKHSNEKVDMWAVGCVILELLRCSTPFQMILDPLPESKQRFALRSLYLSNELEAHCRIPRQLPPKLRAIVSGCLSFDTHRRLSAHTLHEFLEDNRRELLQELILWQQQLDLMTQGLNRGLSLGSAVSRRYEMGVHVRVNNNNNEVMTHRRAPLHRMIMSRDSDHLVVSSASSSESSENYPMANKRGGEVNKDEMIKASTTTAAAAAAVAARGAAGLNHLHEYSNSNHGSRFAQFAAAGVGEPIVMTQFSNKSLAKGGTAAEVGMTKDHAHRYCQQQLKRVVYRSPSPETLLLRGNTTTHGFGVSNVTHHILSHNHSADTPWRGGTLITTSAGPPRDELDENTTIVVQNNSTLSSGNMIGRFNNNPELDALLMMGRGVSHNASRTHYHTRTHSDTNYQTAKDRKSLPPLYYVSRIHSPPAGVSTGDATASLRKFYGMSSPRSTIDYVDARMFDHTFQFPNCQRITRGANLPVAGGGTVTAAAAAAFAAALTDRDSVMTNAFNNHVRSSLASLESSSTSSVDGNRVTTLFPRQQQIGRTFITRQQQQQPVWFDSSSSSFEICESDGMTTARQRHQFVSPKTNIMSRADDLYQYKHFSNNSMESFLLQHQNMQKRRAARPLQPVIRHNFISGLG